MKNQYGSWKKQEEAIIRCLERLVSLQERIKNVKKKSREEKEQLEQLTFEYMEAWRR